MTAPDIVGADVDGVGRRHAAVGVVAELAAVSGAPAGRRALVAQGAGKSLTGGHGSDPGERHARSAEAGLAHDLRVVGVGVLLIVEAVAEVWTL